MAEEEAIDSDSTKPADLDRKTENVERRPKKHRGRHKEESGEKKTSDSATGEVPPEKSAEAPAASQVDTAALENRLLRLQADFDNFRKRMLREKEELWARAHAGVIEELLPVLDHLDLALEAAAKHDAPEAFVEGFRIVSNQFGATLKKFGLTPQDTIGQPFDPNLHEAVAHMPSDDAPANHVVAQARRGYLLGDKLLRAAQVVVSSGPASQTPEEESEGDSGA